MFRSFLSALAVAAALALAASGCGGTEVATAPVVSGPAPALDGTWDFDMERATVNCIGVMTIDGSTGSGTFQGCGSTTGSEAGSVDASDGVVLLFSPAGLQQFWVGGKLYSAGHLNGLIYGPSWNGQQVFDAVRRWPGRRRPIRTHRGRRRPTSDPAEGALLPRRGNVWPPPRGAPACA